MFTIIIYQSITESLFIQHHSNKANAIQGAKQAINNMLKRYLKGFTKTNEKLTIKH